MNVKVDDLMVEKVLTTHPEETVGVVRRRILRKNIHCLPVVDGEGHPVGIVTTSDLVEAVDEETPVSAIMTDKIFTVPRYDDVHVAARIMRNHGIHHLVVTHEQKVTGILSSFDLLKLVEEHRFVMKNPPPESRRRSGSRS